MVYSKNFRCLRAFNANPGSFRAETWQNPISLPTDVDFFSKNQFLRPKFGGQNLPGWTGGFGAAEVGCLDMLRLCCDWRNLIIEDIETMNCSKKSRSGWI